MAITVRCPCGGETSVAERFAGHRVACPLCKRPVLVPLPEGAAVAPPTPLRDAPAEPRPRVPISTRKKEWDGSLPFPLLVLGVLFRPFKTLEYAGTWLASPTNLVLAFCLFVGSVGAQAYLGALQYEQLSAKRSGREPSTSEKLAAKPVPVKQAVVVTIVAASLLVLFHAFAVDLVGRLVSGAGQLLLLLAALALVYGVMNLLDFGLVLSCAKANQWQAAIVARWLVLSWSVILGIVTVMKVYDFDFKLALGTCFLAWTLRQLALFFLARALAATS